MKAEGRKSPSFFSFLFFFPLLLGMVSHYFRRPISTAKRVSERGVLKVILQTELQKAQGLLGGG